jgi:DNA-binding response OmpR family regulator
MARLLIIDDEPEVIKPLAEWLRMHHHDVVEAYTAEEGFRQAQRERPELVMLDLCLPDQSGLRLCRRLQALPEMSRVPVVVLSALTEEYREEGMKIGVKGFLSKPYDLAQVLQTVTRVLNAGADAA